MAVIDKAICGGAAAWIVPTYKNSRPLWRFARATVAPAVAAGHARVLESGLLIEFASGGFVGVYTADNPTGILGESFDLVVCDEAARFAPEVWTETILPTLADRGGRAILISTPRGLNWFYQEWVRGQDPLVTEYASWQRPTRDNPNPRIRKAADMARGRIPERAYLQEWEAQFLTDGGAVFRNVRAAATATRQDKAVTGHTYVIGVDWGKSDDFTVFAVVDATAGALVALDRSNHVDYAVQRGRLAALCAQFSPTAVVAEANAMGTPIIENLQRAGLPVYPFTTTNATKAAIIDGLSLAFERGTLAILPDDVLIGELQAYTSDRLPSGLTRYSAPVGMHDDTVMALALAWHFGGRIEHVDITSIFGD